MPEDHRAGRELGDDHVVGNVGAEREAGAFSTVSVAMASLRCGAAFRRRRVKSKNVTGGPKGPSTLDGANAVGPILEPMRSAHLRRPADRGRRPGRCLGRPASPDLGRGGRQPLRLALRHARGRQRRRPRQRSRMSYTEPRRAHARPPGPRVGLRRSAATCCAASCTRSASRPCARWRGIGTGRVAEDARAATWRSRAWSCESGTRPRAASPATASSSGTSWVRRRRSPRARSRRPR